MAKKLSQRAQISIELLMIVGMAIVLALVAGLTLKNIFKGVAPETDKAITDTAQDAGGT